MSVSENVVKYRLIVYTSSASWREGIAWSIDVCSLMTFLSFSPTFIGQQGQLSGCHNDVGNIKQYLINNQGFKEKDMLILMDDGQHHPPTKKNIQDSFKRITEYSRANDVVFIHYSGHGGRVEDLNGDEKDGYDETLIPSDYKKAGQILDDDVYKMVVDPMPEGVTVVALVRTVWNYYCYFRQSWSRHADSGRSFSVLPSAVCQMDCCHSGSAMDLPYEMNETDSGGMHENKGFGGMGAIMEEPAAMICCACLAFLFVDGLLDFLG
jgi:hypothetical protein